MSRELTVVAAVVVRWGKRCGVRGKDVEALGAVEVRKLKRLCELWQARRLKWLWCDSSDSHPPTP